MAASVLTGCVGEWPPGLPVPIHEMDADRFFAGEGDSSLASYVPDAAALLLDRVRRFLADR